MKQSILFLLVFIPAIAMAQKEPKQGTVKYLDYKRSFKEITLGAPIETVEEAVIEVEGDEVQPGVTTYKVVDEDMLKIADLVEIKEMNLYVFDGKIAMLIMVLEKPNGRNLHDLFSEAYGRGYKNNQFMDQYAWIGKEVSMILDYDGLKQDNLAMIDNRLQAEMDNYAKEKNKKALQDF